MAIAGGLKMLSWTLPRPEMGLAGGSLYHWEKRGIQSRTIGKVGLGLAFQVNKGRAAGTRSAYRRIEKVLDKC